MKDTTISAKSKKRELSIFAICFGVAFILNVIAIINHNTDWIEVLSMLHIVLLVAVILYVIHWVIRLIVLGIKRLIKRKKETA